MNRSIFLVILLPMLFIGCKKDEGQKKPFMEISDSEITVTNVAGKAYITLNWAYSEWELEIVEDSFLSDFTFRRGGSESHSGTTRIQFQYEENTGGEERTEEFVLRNRTSGTMIPVKVMQRAALPTIVEVNPAVRYQPIEGFGGMYNQALWFGEEFLLNSEELAKLYGPGGLGYKIIHVVINPDNTRWAIDVPGLKQLQGYGATVFLSGEYPKALAEARVVNGKDTWKLKEENYQAYTDHLISYIDFMEANGVKIYALSIQNEPDMTNDFFWYPEELVAYIKGYAQQIRAKGVKVMAPESLGYQPSYTDPFLTDAEAFGKTDILAGHFYQGFIDTADNSYVKNRHDYIKGLYNQYLRAAGKTWWMTEHLYNDGGDQDDPDKWEFRKWDYNLKRFGLELHMSMEAYCSAYIYFYLKRYYSMIADPDPKSAVPVGEITKPGYIMGHYAKYATGRTRINVINMPKNLGLYVTAYEGDNDITLIMQNHSSEELSNIHFTLPFGASGIEAELTTETISMADKEVALSDDKKTILASFEPNSIISMRILK